MKKFTLSLCATFLLLTIAVFGQSGTIDTSFGTQGFLSKTFWGKNIYGTATIAIQHDGKILAGAAIAPNIYTDMIVARFSANGVLDSTFGDTGKIVVNFLGRNDGVNAIIALADGKILVGGYANDAANITSYALLKLTDNGKLDSSFGTNGKQIIASNSVVNAMEVQSNGKIIIRGNSDIVRLFSDGSIDPSFGINGIVNYSGISDMIVLSSDKILVTGGVGMKTSRFLPDGTLDVSFGVDGTFENFDTTICSSTGGNRLRKDFNAKSLCIDVNGNIYVGGLYKPRNTASPCTLSSSSLPVVVKLTPSGTIVTGYGTNGWTYPFGSSANSSFNYTVISLGIQTSTNKLIVSGSATIFRLTPTGIIDSIFGNYGRYSFANSSGLESNIKNILQNDSFLVVGYNWEYTIGMTRLNAGEVIAKPSANFGGQTSPITVGTIIEFTDGSTNSFSREWRFSPNTINYYKGNSSSWDMSVIFDQPGTYAVSLTAYNYNRSDSSVIIKNFVVGLKPSARFEVNSTVGDTGSIFNFFDSSLNVPTTWLWTFIPNNVQYQNGTSSTSKNPVVKFKSQGFFSVKLKATSPYGMDTLTKTNYIIITKTPNPNFTSNQFGDTNAIFKFSDATLSSAPLTYQWNFLPNDVTFMGSTDSSSQNPEVKFKSYGAYTVKLKVKSVNGEDSISKTNWIEIGHAPVARFGSSQLTGTTTTKFYLKDSSASGPNKRKWTISPSTVLYQNGTTDTSQSPIVSFSQIGVYTIRLVVTNKYGVDSVSEVNYIQIGVLPIVDFRISSTIGATGKQFNLYDSSSNAPTSWLWKFSPATVTFLDGTSETSKNPVVSFTNIGAYEVKLLVYNMYGADSIVKSNYVQIGSLPIANFGISDTVGNTNTLFNLYDSSSNAPASWFWSFSPSTVIFQSGTSSTSQNPVVSFSVAGIYQLKLMVQNLYGTDSITKSNLISITTGIKEEMQASHSIVSLYPNPSTGEVFMSNIFGNKEPVEMQVFDIKGEVIIRKTLYPDSAKKTLSLLSDSHVLSNGLYFMEMQQSGHSYRGKVSICQ